MNEKEVTLIYDTVLVLIKQRDLEVNGTRNWIAVDGLIAKWVVKLIDLKIAAYSAEKALSKLNIKLTTKG